MGNSVIAPCQVQFKTLKNEKLAQKFRYPTELFIWQQDPPPLPTKKKKKKKPLLHGRKENSRLIYSLGHITALILLFYPRFCSNEHLRTHGSFTSDYYYYYYYYYYFE
jgi:hypothetical protein